MKRFKIHIALFLCLFIPALQGCDFGDTNVNPNASTQAPIRILLAPAITQLAYAYGGDIAQYTGILTQQVTGIDREHLNVARYNFTPQLATRPWDDRLYAGSMINLNIIMQKATELDAPHYRGVAKVLMAMAIGNNVDLWNNIPYSQSFNLEKFPKPAFDKGEDLYKTVQQLLNEGITDLGAASSFVSPGNDDLIYNGNRTKWIMAARALKARYANHLSKLNPTQSAQDALAAINEGTFKSNDDDAKVIFGTTLIQGSPWFAFLSSTWGTDVVLSKFFVDLLQTRKDPRLPLYATPNTAGQFVGTPAGSSAVTNTSTIGSYYRRANAPTNFITYTEVKFIEAEANLRLGKTAEAAAAHNAAVKASLMKVTGKADATYETAYASETASTISLEKIMTEKYIALWLEPEAWTDWRRTGFPALTPATNNITNNVIPRRFPYPLSEIQNNKANVDAQGPSQVTDRVFWDK